MSAYVWAISPYVERNEGNMCTHEEFYVIEFVTMLFLFADILVTRTHFKNSSDSVHAMPREIWHGYVSYLVSHCLNLTFYGRLEKVDIFVTTKGGPYVAEGDHGW